MREAGRSARRAWLPPALLLGAAAASWVAYNHSAPALAHRVVPVYAACLVAGPSLVYPWMRAWGASAAAAGAGAWLVPCAWLVKEGWRITAVFSVPEAVYYAFNPLALGLYVAVLFQIGVWELVMRRPWNRGWRLARGPALALLALLGLSAALSLLGRGSGGSEVFYAYSALHARLFDR
jgi:hypothetical protein